MTSLAPSESSDSNCPKCGAPLSERPLRKYPVLLQIAFGMSFALFLILSGQIILPKPLLWGWTLLQVGLGVLLWRARHQANRRVYRCVRCDPHLR